MDREEIIQRFQKMNVWQSRDKRAVHKPLLVLYSIGKLLRGEDRLTLYQDVEEFLPNLLREFGPWREKYNPADPFWRLQNDGLWEVNNTQNVHVHKDNASARDMKQYMSSGGFPEEIASKLQDDYGMTFEIIGRLLVKHFPISYHEDILQDVGIELSFGFSEQPRDPYFRHNVLEAYGYRCAICGFNMTLRDRHVALEAAHIKWHMAEGPDTEKNGIALCSLHHKLFDRGVFTLSDRLKLHVSEHVDRTSVGFDEWLKPYDGQEIGYLPNQVYYPNEEYTNWHLREVFKGDYSDL
ncbi:restriction endonuclease [Candidatus Poribacteria bacterium]|nr:MAG: restriction endonuclease [Candidatus Poribacteria bacterium]